jgi:LPS sulfotransferase NodH
MLVVLNGAQKGGSTWLAKIVQAMNFCERVPEEFKVPGWTSSSISEDKLDLFLNSFDLTSRNFYCKQHWHSSNRFKELIEHPDVRMVNIIRDIRDVLISRYFHDLRLDNTQESDLEVYFDLRGRDLMRQYMEYHTFWHGNENSIQPFLCSYERLHSDFNSQVVELIEYLNLSYDNTTIKRIEMKTSFSSMKITGEGEFFRKGTVGDWRNYLSDRIINDLKKLANDVGYLETKRKMLKKFSLSILEQIDFGIA